MLHLQVLFHNVRFRNALYSHAPAQDDTGKVILTLQQLMVDLEWSYRGVIDTAGRLKTSSSPSQRHLFLEQKDFESYLHHNSNNSFVGDHVRLTN